MPCNFVSVSRCWVCVVGQVLVAGLRLFLSPVCVFSFVVHHNIWTPSSLAVFSLYPSNPSPRHLICYTYLHWLHLSIDAATTFVHIVLVLSSISESALKTGLVFAYELGFQHSIYQNRSEIFFRSIHPCFIRVGYFYFGQKLVTRSSFRGHKLSVNFEHVFWIFHRPHLSLF